MCLFFFEGEDSFTHLKTQCYGICLPALTFFHFSDKALLCSFEL